MLLKWSSYQTALTDGNAEFQGTAGHLAVRGAKQVAAAFPDGGKVTLCARSEIRQRQFDLALPWMGRERAHMLCHHFWAHSASERLEIQGGSVTVW